MLQRIIPILKMFLIFLGFFVFQKIIFVLYNTALYPDISLSDYFQIIKAGFTMDISMASYITVIPWLLGLVLLAIPISKPHVGSWFRKFLHGYALVFAFIISAIYVVDMGLFSYWEFRLDSTPIFYFLSSPKSAMASGTMIEYALAIMLVAIYTWGLYQIIMRGALKSKHWQVQGHKRITSILLMLLAGGLLFLGIRGGWTVSTMNTGRAYFSSNDRLNQAAINPVFSLMESLTKGDKIGKQYQYFKESEMQVLVDSLYARKAPEIDQLEVLNTKRPDIYILVLESFSSALMESKIEGQPITPILNSLVHESVYFSNFFCNSFRTDRGLISILSGYPAQPSTSIMKYPRKAAKLSGIGSLLKKADYDLNYYYGGDINFTNLNAYLKKQGFDHIVSDVDFPMTDKLSKWGVHDHIVFNKVVQEMGEKQTDKPQLTVIQSSSSHEPFEVPFEKFKQDKPNAFAYTDHCMGQFIEGLKAANKWDNSLVIIVPDHYGAYPEGFTKYDKIRFEVPLIWTGGAVKEARIIETIGSQMDIAATLMGQLGIEPEGLDYSSNVLDSNAPHFAYFSHSGYMGIVNAKAGFALNLVTNELMWTEGALNDSLLLSGKALLQSVYKDIASK